MALGAVGGVQRLWQFLWEMWHTRHLGMWRSRCCIDYIQPKGSNAGVLQQFDDSFVRDDFVEIILNSSWPE